MIVLHLVVLESIPSIQARRYKSTNFFCSFLVLLSNTYLYTTNIDGVFSPLALFSPPIDPGALVRAAAAGVNISDFLQGLNAPLPIYRFNYMISKAVELTQDVNNFGGKLLQALERRDAEMLARLQSSQ